MKGMGGADLSAQKEFIVKLRLSRRTAPLETALGNIQENEVLPSSE